MFWTIVRKEAVDHFSSFRFVAIFVLAILLMVTSVVVFSVTYGNAIKEYPRRVYVVNEEGKTDLAWLPCAGGISVRQAPSPLGFCSGTGEQVLPNQAFMSVNSLDALQRVSDVGEILRGATHVDWAFVISVLLSFAAGLLSYKSVSGELRDGTLTLMLSNAIPRATVLLGKYLAALLALSVVLTIALLFGLIVLQNLGAVQLRGDDWLKVGLVWLVSLVFLSIFILIGLLCSVSTRSPLISAVAFLFTWTVLVFVIPSLGGILATQMNGVKTPLQIKALAQAVPNQLPLRPGMSEIETAAVDLRRELAREQLLIEYVQSLARQVHLGQDLTRISPASTFSYAVEEIVGGGTFRFMRFVDNAARFREGFLRAMIEADKQDPESEHRYVPGRCGPDFRNFSHRVVDLGPAKEFRDLPPTSAEGLRAAFTDLALLIVCNGLVFFITFYRFTRQDVAPASGM